jgi:hypothetical protein
MIDCSKLGIRNNITGCARKGQRKTNLDLNDGWRLAKGKLSSNVGVVWCVTLHGGKLGQNAVDRERNAFGNATKKNYNGIKYGREFIISE